MIKIDNARKLYTDEVEIGPLNIKIPKAIFNANGVVGYR